jgi:hypothetical protein
LPLSRLPRREDLASRFGNSVRAVTGDRLVWGALNSKGSTRMSLFQTADRIDYSIRRYIHATDHLWSPPQALRRSRANGAPQSKLISATDRSVWLSIGHYLRVQYDALSAPVPPHITALVEQLEMRNWRPAAMRLDTCMRKSSKFEEQGGVSCMHKSGTGSITIR